MTTIAYRNGVMASDSKISSSSGVYVGQTKKIFIFENEEGLSWYDLLVRRKEPKKKKFLVGMCGALEDCIEYMDCIFKGEQQTRSFDSSLIVVDQEGTIRKFDGDNVKGFVVDADYASVGSGYEIALGALHHGATAEEAIEAAIFHDNSSGGKIQTLSFDKNEE